MRSGEVRQPIPAAPGQLERYDYEYRRNGTVNLFVVLDVHRPWRKVRLTERRATMLNACATSSTSTFRTPTRSGCCRTTCRPIPPEPSIKPTRPQRPVA